MVVDNPLHKVWIAANITYNLSTWCALIWYRTTSCDNLDMVHDHRQPQPAKKVRLDFSAVAACNALHL